MRGPADVGDDEEMADPDVRAVLLAAGAVTAVLVTVVVVLAVGRARAWRVVAAQTDELHHQELHDTLTDLPNRALVADRLDQVLARARRDGRTCAAVFVDLDDFRNINDSLGHGAGDQLLIAVADRLTSMLREVATVGRMGGDEYVVLLDGGDHSPSPELVAGRILDVIRQPFDLDGLGPLAVTASAGVAVGLPAVAGDLLRDAEVALQQAKASGKDRAELFVAAMHTGDARRIELEFDLRSAVDEGQFTLVYQPIYRLDDLCVVGVEALLRWDHPTLGRIEPDEFIPILERTGQIRAVGRWVLLEACRQLAAWHVEGHVLDMSVNVSGRQLDHDEVVEDIRRALEAGDLEPRSLVVEVTETALMQDVGETVGRLQAIKALGVRIAIDDFGTGYSSLAYLQQFPVDCLKIDRTFTNAITTSKESKALIGTLVQLGRDLGLTTLAEGVETAAEVEHLRRERVHQVQGHLLSSPLDPQTLEVEVLVPARMALTSGGEP
jgi:diguanylate cyclase (GGDEF)-like protein